MLVEIGAWRATLARQQPISTKSGTIGNQALQGARIWIRHATRGGLENSGLGGAGIRVATQDLLEKGKDKHIPGCNTSCPPWV